MFEDKLVNNKEYKLLTEHLDKPRTPVFYGLPKIHKQFNNVPPLRPIVSGYNSCTSRLSEYIDSYLKYQAQRCKSYIRDTKDFLNKLKSITNLPSNSILVTMDVSSLYTNIDHEEGAQACYESLEQRHNKQITSSLIKKLILLVLKSNAFRFGELIYHQIKGTAMAPNYANLFLNKLEINIVHEFYLKTGLKPLVWMRYIDDIFFIWTHDDKNLQEFIQFANNYTTSNKMKSNIKFESHISKESVNFLDVKVNFNNGFITTSVYSKPTDAHLYLNAQSSHPSHVIKNIPKGQFIRLKRICSDDKDFNLHAKTLSTYFINRKYDKQLIKSSLEEVKLMHRDDLLKDHGKNIQDPWYYICMYMASIHQIITQNSKSKLPSY